MSKLDGFRQLAQRLGTDGARGVSYAVALGAITVLLDTAGLPTEFIEISKGLWINSMVGILGMIMNKEMFGIGQCARLWKGFAVHLYQNSHWLFRCIHHATFR